MKSYTIKKKFRLLEELEREKKEKMLRRHKGITCLQFLSLKLTTFTDYDNIEIFQKGRIEVYPIWKN